MSLGAVISIVVPVITFVVTAVVGSDLRAGDFRALLRRPRLIVAGVLVPPVVLPPLAFGLIALLQPPPAIAMGLLLVASCPVGGISNAFTFLAQGTVSLSLLLTATSCLTAVLTMPAIGAVLSRVEYQALVTAPPAGPLFVHVLVAVALPASIGMFARNRWPERADRMRPVLWRLAVVLLGLLIALIILNDVPAFMAALRHAVPLAVCFISASLGVGAGVGQAIGARGPDRVALSIEFATRNVAVATMTAVTVMGHVEFAIFGTAYFLTEVPLMAGGALAMRARSRRRMVLAGDVAPGMRQ